MTTNTDDRLADLERRAHDEMARTEALCADWPDVGGEGQGTYAVVICGAGLSGLSIAFALKRRGIRSVRVIDQNKKGEEGPWVTCARMRTLRSPKYLSGPDLGIASLTVRSWYEAVYGMDAWEVLDRISRIDWMDYLNWFRKVAGIEVENGTRLAAIRPQAEGLALVLDHGDGGTRIISCRQLVLATGIDGCGGPSIPDVIKALPKSAWTHSSDPVDIGFAAGRRLAVLGGGTSSFDWTVAALDAGARNVTMFSRNPDFPRTEVLAWTNFPGFLGHFADLPDHERWRFSRLYFDFKVPPTQDQYDRAVAHPSFEMKLGYSAESFSMDGDKVRLATNRGTFTFDHLLLGTGYRVDFGLRPELRELAGVAALWGDRFQAPAGEENAVLAGYPYLGPGFELTAKRPGSDGWLSRVRMFNAAALVSLGPVSNGVTGLKYGVPRIVDTLVKALFTEDSARYLAALAAYREQHFDPRSGKDGNLEASL
jgi:cation diffusion facilitator CzcD-associated flavoprotein CzcO